eukprot:NODE_102_length_19640_cov_1.308735.p1 type:complete len:1069 gc:universal NODE_102_length_19640_cov_1.308735:11205-7999(-)
MFLKIENIVWQANGCSLERFDLNTNQKLTLDLKSDILAMNKTFIATKNGLYKKVEESYKLYHSNPIQLAHSDPKMLIYTTGKTIFCLDCEKLVFEIKLDQKPDHIFVIGGIYKTLLVLVGLQIKLYKSTICVNTGILSLKNQKIVSATELVVVIGRTMYDLESLIPIYQFDKELSCFSYENRIYKYFNQNANSVAGSLNIELMKLQYNLLSNDFCVYFVDKLKLDEVIEFDISDGLILLKTPKLIKVINLESPAILTDSAILEDSDPNIECIKSLLANVCYNGPVELQFPKQFIKYLKNNSYFKELIQLLELYKQLSETSSFIDLDNIISYNSIFESLLNNHDILADSESLLKYLLLNSDYEYVLNVVSAKINSLSFDSRVKLLKIVRISYFDDLKHYSINEKSTTDYSFSKYIQLIAKQNNFHSLDEMLILIEIMEIFKFQVQASGIFELLSLIMIRYCQDGKLSEFIFIFDNNHLDIYLQITIDDIVMESLRYDDMLLHLPDFSNIHLSQKTIEEVKKWQLQEPRNLSHLSQLQSEIEEDIDDNVFIDAYEQCEFLDPIFQMNLVSAAFQFRNDDKIKKFQSPEYPIYTESLKINHLLTSKQFSYIKPEIPQLLLCHILTSDPDWTFSEILSYFVNVFLVHCDKSLLFWMNILEICTQFEANISLNDESSLDIRLVVQDCLDATAEMPYLFNLFKEEKFYVLSSRLSQLLNISSDLKNVYSFNESLYNHYINCSNYVGCLQLLHCASFDMQDWIKDQYLLIFTNLSSNLETLRNFIENPYLSKMIDVSSLNINDPCLNSVIDFKECSQLIEIHQKFMKFSKILTSFNYPDYIKSRGLLWQVHVLKPERYLSQQSEKFTQLIDCMDNLEFSIAFLASKLDSMPLGPEKFQFTKYFLNFFQQFESSGKLDVAYSKIQKKCAQIQADYYLQKLHLLDIKAMQSDLLLNYWFSNVKRIKTRFQLQTIHFVLKLLLREKLNTMKDFDILELMNARFLVGLILSMDLTEGKHPIFDFLRTSDERILDEYIFLTRTKKCGLNLTDSDLLSMEKTTLIKMLAKKQMHDRIKQLQ